MTFIEANVQYINKKITLFVNTFLKNISQIFFFSFSIIHKKCQSKIKKLDKKNPFENQMG